MNSQSSFRRILVTGGAGFIGTHLCRKLVEAGQAVRVIDLRKPSDPVEGVEYLQGDVRDASLMLELVGRADLVYHLAAVVSVPLCQKDPIDSYSTNFTGTLVVLDSIRRAAQARGTSAIPMVFASTAALYANRGDDGRALKEEDAATCFSSFYAAQKHASEQAMDQYFKAFGVPSIAFRFFNVFGPGQDPTSPYSGVITIFARFAKEGKPLPLNAGGIQTRDFISVYDIVSGLYAAQKLERTQWTARAFNLGTGHSITVREIGELIVKSAGSGSSLIDAPPRGGDVMHSLASINLARELIHFAPKDTLQSVLQKLLKFF